MYSEKVLDHFAHPRNSGTLPEADARVIIENPVCGDVLELAVTIKESRIEHARFRAKGCVPLMACSSMLAEMIEGLSLEDAERIGAGEFADKAGQLPQASGHVTEMAVDAVRQLIKQLLALRTMAAQRSDQ